MKIQIATPELVVLEAENGDLDEQSALEQTIRSVLETEGLAQWDSIEIEAFTYNDKSLLFAKPVKLFVPGFLARLLD